MAAEATRAKVAGVVTLMRTLYETKLAEFETQVLAEHNTWLEEIAAETRKTFHTDAICLPKTPSAKRKRATRTRAQKDKENAPADVPVANGRVTRARAAKGATAAAAPAPVEVAPSTDDMCRKPSPKRRRTDENEADTASAPSTASPTTSLPTPAPVVDMPAAAPVPVLASAVADGPSTATDVVPMQVEEAVAEVVAETKQPAAKRGRGKRTAAAQPEEAPTRTRGKRQKTAAVAQPAEPVHMDAEAQQAAVLDIAPSVAEVPAAATVVEAAPSASEVEAPVPTPATPPTRPPEALSVSVTKVTSMVQFWETKTKTPAKEEKRPAPSTAAVGATTAAGAAGARGKKRLGKATVQGFGSPQTLAIAAPALSAVSVAHGAAADAKLEVLLSPVKKGEEPAERKLGVIPPQPELPAPKRAPRKAKAPVPLPADSTPKEINSAPAVDAVANSSVPVVPAVVSASAPALAEKSAQVQQPFAATEGSDAFSSMKRDVLRVAQGNRRRPPTRANKSRSEDVPAPQDAAPEAMDVATAPVAVEQPTIADVTPAAVPVEVTTSPVTAAAAGASETVPMEVDAAPAQDESTAQFVTPTMSFSEPLADVSAAVEDVEMRPPSAEDGAPKLPKPVNVVTTLRAGVPPAKPQAPSNIATGSSFVASLQRQQQQKELDAKAAQKMAPQVKALKVAEAAKKAAEKRAEEKKAQQAYFAKEKERRLAEKAASTTAPSGATSAVNASLLNSSVTSTARPLGSTLAGPKAPLVSVPYAAVLKPRPEMTVAEAAPVVAEKPTPPAIQPQPQPAKAAAPAEPSPVGVPSATAKPTMPVEQTGTAVPAKRNYEEQERLLLQRLAERQKQQADRYASQQGGAAQVSPVSTQATPAPEPTAKVSPPSAPTTAQPPVQQPSTQPAQPQPQQPQPVGAPPKTTAVANPTLVAAKGASVASVPAVAAQPQRHMIKLTVPADPPKASAASAQRPPQTQTQPHQPTQAAPVAAASSSRSPARAAPAQREDETYEMTPEVKERKKKDDRTSDETYNIDDLDSGESTDDDEAPRRKIPAWAQGPALKAAIYNQHIDLNHRNIDPDTVFPRVQTPDLNVIFPDGKRKNERYVRRGSSAQWAMEYSPTAPAGVRPKKML